MNLWQEVLKWFGGITMLAGMLAYLTKSIISHSLSKDLEKFKGDLDRKLEDHKDELEKQRKLIEHNLEVLAQEHAAKFTQLHEKRVSLLAEMNYLLAETYLEMDWLNGGCKEESGSLVEGATREAMAKNRRLSDFFKRNKLYFSKALADQIQAVVFALQNFPFDLAISTGPDHKPEEVTQARKRFVEDWEKQSPGLNQAMSSVEAEFRRLLASDVETFARTSG